MRVALRDDLIATLFTQAYGISQKPRCEGRARHSLDLAGSGAGLAECDASFEHWLGGLSSCHDRERLVAIGSPAGCENQKNCDSDSRANANATKYQRVGVPNKDERAADGEKKAIIPPPNVILCIVMPG